MNAKFAIPRFLPGYRRAKRSILFLAALALVLGAAACAANPPANASAPAGDAPLTVDGFPNGLGRGFPIVSIAADVERPQRLEPGEPAPQFTLSLEDGRSLALTDLRGHPVLINFWATWCPPCRSEMPDIVRQAQADEELIVLAVNVQEDAQTVRAFAEEYEMTMPVVRDEAAELQELYLIRGMPTSFFLDRDGIITAKWEGMLSAERLDSMLAGIR